MRHALRRPTEVSVHPVFTTVGGYFHPADHPTTGPGQAPDLVESSAGQIESPGRPRDDRLRSDLITQGGLVGVLTKMPVVVVGHVEPIDHLDSAQPLHVEDTLKARNHDPQREALLGA